jgi:superfamily II DNA or RNA helicase/HKD family nuclease
MPQAGLPEGAYDQLITAGLDALIRQSALEAHMEPVDQAESTEILAAHLEKVAIQVLDSVPVDRRLAVANALLSRLLEEVTRPGANLDEADLVASFEDGRAHALLAVGPATPRPRNPLRRADLLINARGEPALHEELAAEIASADQVDLLCAFIKWQGLRLLTDAIAEHRRRGRPIRVITTTYVGATERKAIDKLVELGADVKISYETRTTRLHAKAWLFRRNSGWDTGYVGSSNLSRSALVDGLEWNVRLSSGDTPLLLHKFAATFDSYWADPRFEPYDPETDAQRLDRALQTAHDPTPISLAGLQVTPYPYQQEMLDQLDVERRVHDRWRNLVVAATGTGKTVVAALDYRRLREERGDLSLLFVAHRREILEQSRATFAAVMTDGTFGEIWVAGRRPSEWRHVFASVQSLHADGLASVEPTQFDMVIVDEFHHAEAETYRRLLEHIQPQVLLGLTATPERADGGDVTEWFDGHISTELRLWHALEQDLLCPFNYFGIADNTDLRGLAWNRGTYDLSGLSNLYTGNDARGAIVIRNLRDIVTDVGGMRALGFCVSIDHAHYMARVFNKSGIPAVAVDATTDATSRAAALRDLRDRKVNAVFAVDLFNEGLDVPQVDTVLFLRPTESATVFLQQLGRGLRRTAGKACLTALDFVGQHDRRFRWDVRYRALTGSSRADLINQIQHGFPFLPAGSSIQLDRVARELVLDNVRAQITMRRPQLIEDVRSYGDLTLNGYLQASGREPTTIYRPGQSWTALRRAAGLPVSSPGPNEDQLLRRASRFLHIDDRERLDVWRQVLDSPGPRAMDNLGKRESRMLLMLFFNLWPSGGGFSEYAAGWEQLWANPAVRHELVQVLDVAASRISHVPVRLSGSDSLPLWVHCRYTREELLAAVGRATLEKPPANDREGVRYSDGERVDVFTFTLSKTEQDYSPTTMYRDYAISPELIHWESQSTTSADSPTGLRYIDHAARGSRILLFCRETNAGDFGARPYFFLGPARYVSHTGSRPMAITWKLDHPMPADFYESASMLAG